MASLAGCLYLVSALAPVGPNTSLVILLAGRLLLGCAESLFLTGTMTWAIATVGVQNTGRVMAWQGIAIFGRSEEHTSELQSLMRISYAVFCLKKKKQLTRQTQTA